MTSESASIADLVGAITKLGRHIEKTEIAVMKLGARMRQADNEEFAPCNWYDELQAMLVRSAPRNLPAAMMAVRSCEDRLRGIDLHMNAIRKHLQAIEGDADQRLTYREWFEK